MKDSEHFVVHPEPAWRERSDFIIHAKLAESDEPRRYEQLWARDLTNNRFEICCIPFFLYDLALGDVVATMPHEDHEFVVERVVESSGRFVFRVWFGETVHPRDEIAERLQALGALLEWSSVNLMAVDAADEAQARNIDDFLRERQQLGQLLYETGKPERVREPPWSRGGRHE